MCDFTKTVAKKRNSSSDDNNNGLILCLNISSAVFSVVKFSVLETFAAF